VTLLSFRTLAILCAVSALSVPALAADAPPPAPAANLVKSPLVPGVMIPAREGALIAILSDAARRYERQRTTQQKADVRVSMEIAISKFMRESQEAEGWVGIVKTIRRTAEGDVWLGLAIAPDIMISTLQDRTQDREFLTLIRNPSPLWPVAAQGLAIGQAVVFDARMLIYDVSNNDGMIERPHIVARFRNLHALDDPPPR